MDAVRGSKSIPLKKVSAKDQSRVSVRAMSSDFGSFGKRPIPDEYKTIDRGRSGGWGFIVFLFLLFAATAGGFYYWNSRPPVVQGDSMTLAVDGPSSLVSGSAITYTLSYQNKDLVAMRTVELDVQWPDGFYYDSASSEPTATTATTWNLGPMDPGQTKKLTIKGQLVGLKDQKQTAVFRMSYRPDNINSDFEIKKTVETVISDAQLDIALDSPSKLLAGQQVTFTATMKNLTADTLTALDIEAILPKDLDLVKSDPALTDGHWKGDIAVDKPLVLTIDAKVGADADGPQSWIIEINQQSNDQARKLLHQELPVTVVKPDFGIDLKINGQSSSFDSDYGEVLNYQVKVTNQSTSPMTDVKVTALMDSDVIDRKNVQSTGTASTDSITWTKEQVPALASLDPGAETLISWKAPLLQKGTVGRASVDTLITVELEGLPDWKKTSSVFVVSVGQGLVFNQGLYWNLAGEKVGTGQLPPVTNEKSVYLVVWSLDSGSQDFDTVSVSAFLPPKVTFVSTDDVDEGTLKFDPDTNRLEWQINNFSSKLLPLKATFKVKLVPTDEDKGTIMQVLNPATIVASGKEVFQTKSFGITTSQVVTTEPGDVGTVIE